MKCKILHNIYNMIYVYIILYILNAIDDKWVNIQMGLCLHSQINCISYFPSQILKR